MNESGILNYRSWQGEGEKNEINPCAGNKDDSLFVAFMHFTLYNKNYKAPIASHVRLTNRTIG